MEKKLIKMAPCISDITIDAHFDFKSDDWSASATLITLCLSGVLIYWIKVWGDKNTRENYLA